MATAGTAHVPITVAAVKPTIEEPRRVVENLLALLNRAEHASEQVFDRLCARSHFWLDDLTKTLTGRMDSLFLIAKRRRTVRVSDHLDV